MLIPPPRRIWNMTKTMIIPFVIVLLGLVSFGTPSQPNLPPSRNLTRPSPGGGIWLTQKIVEVKYFARKPDLHWAALVWLVAAAAADILITVALVWNLARRKTGFSHTDDVINAIIRSASFAVGAGCRAGGPSLFILPGQANTFPH